METTLWCRDVVKLKEACDHISYAVGKEKLSAIREVCSDQQVMAGVSTLVNPMITFGIGEKSLSKENLPPPSCQFMLLSQIVYSLTNTNITNQDIANVKDYINRLPEELRDFVTQYLCKTLVLGVSSRTLNKAFGTEIVQDVHCMLGKKYANHKDKVEGKTFYLTEKLDGVRCIAVAGNNSVFMFTRQGKSLEGFEEIEHDLMEIAQFLKRPMVFDGELIITDRDGYPSKEQYKRTINVVSRNGEKAGVTYHIFDVLQCSEYEQKTGKYNYEWRRGILDHIDEICKASSMKHVEIVPVLYHGNDTSKIMEKLDEQRAMQHEGVMINIADEYYRFGRTDCLLKCKVMQDCDLRITWMMEGEGKNKGTLGALIVDYKGNPVGVGSGFTDAERDMFWKDRIKYLGRVIKVQYFEETNNAEGKQSIRFPVFVELCDEGKEVSYN